MSIISKIAYTILVKIPMEYFKFTMISMTGFNEQFSGQDFSHSMTELLLTVENFQNGKTTPVRRSFIYLF